VEREGGRLILTFTILDVDRGG